MTMADAAASDGRDEAAALQGRERRESERAIRYWERKLESLGGDATVAALDLAEMQSPDWSHRFVIAIDPVVENSALLLYGAEFSRLLDLPVRRTPHVPMVRQLPRCYTEVFRRGCGDADAQRVPVRIEGEVERADGRKELYRAAFIPIGVKKNSITHLAFGAFNSRIAEPALAA